MPGGFDTVLVVDFGAQYAQLIARRVRECHVYSEIVPSTMPVAEMLARRPKAIILSGGPSSVYVDGAPPAPAGLFDAGVPVLGICYGFQLMVAGLGGTVERTGAAEYGATALETNILAWLTPVAIILVMVLGAMAMANRISWGWCIGAILGIAIAFGAPQIVTWVRGMFGV